MALFKDASVCYYKMQKLDSKLGNNHALAGEMVELDIKNRQAWSELENYEKTKTFLFKHPITKQHQYDYTYKQLKKNEPEKFIREITKLEHNISRYKSRLKSKKYTEGQKNNYRKLIDEYKEKLLSIKRILNDNS